MNENQSTMGKTSKITRIKAIERTEQVTTITELNAESYQMLKESWNICHSGGQAEVSWSHLGKAHNV